MSVRLSYVKMVVAALILMGRSIVIVQELAIRVSETNKRLLHESSDIKVLKCYLNMFVNIYLLLICKKMAISTSCTKDWFLMQY